jgi:hypothetical protein
MEARLVKDVEVGLARRERECGAFWGTLGDGCFDRIKWRGVRG